MLDPFGLHRASCIKVYFILHQQLCAVKGKGKGLATCYSTAYRLVTSSALQSRKWQLFGMNQWCRSALCGHPLLELTDNWTHGAASRHIIAKCHI